jgi:hypothetical protein
MSLSCPENSKLAERPMGSNWFCGMVWWTHLCGSVWFDTTMNTYDGGVWWVDERKTYWSGVGRV